MIETRLRRIGIRIAFVLGCALIAGAWLIARQISYAASTQPPNETTIDPAKPLPNVIYSRTPKRPAHLLSARTGVRMRAPKRLTQDKLVAALEAVRVLAGIPQLGQQKLSEPHSQITLTPENPHSGNSFIQMWEVTVLEHIGAYRAQMDYHESAIGLTFETSPGKTYLLDIEICGPHISGDSYRFEGAVSGQLDTDEGGHLLVGFTANDFWEGLWVKPVYPGDAAGDFFEAVLTRVD